MTSENTVNEKQVREIITGDDFKSSIKSLAEISHSPEEKQNGKLVKKAISLVDHPAQFHSYDHIAGQFYKKKDRTPDMILFHKDEIVFVEFKSGKVKPDNVKIKAIEGCFIVLHKIISKYIETVKFADIVKLKKSFILVYSLEANVRKQAQDYLKTSLTRYGLKVYKDTFFSEVETWPQKRFMKWLKDEGFIEE